MSSAPVYDESRNGVDHVRLPYTLTAGVTATREGLEMHDSPSPMYDIMRAMIMPEPMIQQHDAGDRIYTWPWSDVAYRLRYREGEPWCTSSDGSYSVDIVCREPRHKARGITGYIFGQPIKDNPLHRLAAILCDDAEAFRVLHWCVTEMGGRDA
jgi:hypothetical protein